MPSASVPPPATEVLPREHVRDPDLWLVVLCWATVAFAAAQILLFSFGRDQAIYATVADGMLRGQMPYRDVWDFKPPGIFFVYAASLGLLGKSMMAPRLFEVLGLLLMVLGLRRLGGKLFGSETAGLVGGALAALLHAQLDFWHSGQPETYGGYLTVAALVLTVAEPSRKRRIWVWLGIGACFGLAFLFKPPLGGGAMVCAAALSRRTRADGGSVKDALMPVLWTGVGTVLPIVLCIAWFAARGALPEMRWTLGEFTPGYTQLSWVGRSAPEMFYFAVEEAFFKLSALLAAGFIAAIVMRPLHGRETEGFFLVLGIASVQLAGVAMQGKFFQYHYAATIPLIAFVSGAGLYKLWRRLALGSASGVLAFLSFVVVAASMRDPVRDLPNGFWHRSLLRLGYLFHAGPISNREELDKELYYVADYNLDADRRVAIEVSRRTPPGRSTFVWGFEPAVYWMSGTESSSRFIYNVPQRAQWQRDKARRDLMADLHEKPPALLVVQRRDVFPGVTGSPFDSADSLPDFPELASFIDSRYALTNTIEDFDIYEEKALLPPQ
jgi:hypothetical protein